MKKLFFYPSMCVLSIGICYSQTIQWQRIFDSPNVQVHDVKLNSQGHIFAATYGNGIFRSTDGGNNWQQTITGLNTFSFGRLATNSGGHVFAGSYTGLGIYRSTNSGDDWTHLTSGLANDGVNAIAIDSSDRLYIADRGFQGYFYQSTNNGDNWARIDSGLTDLVSAVAFDSLDNILIGSFGVYRSTDSGSTWTDIGLGLPSSYVHSIIVMPDGIILAGMGTEGLFFLTDYGSFWSKLDFSFPGGVLTMALNSTGLMFVGTPVAGVYVSADSGGTWTQSNSGLGSLTARSFAFDSAGHAFLATDVGVYKTVQPVTTVISKSDVTPNSFILSQNYPNPFNPSTTIEFTIPYTGAATLKIFNLLGEEVETLVAGVLSSGRHSVVWNAIGKTSGIYFCQLRTGRFIENRKIIFLR